MVDQIMTIDCQAYDIANASHVEAIVGEIEKRVNSAGDADLFQLSLVFTGGFSVGGGLKAGATTDECAAWFKERVKGQEIPKPLVQEPRSETAVVSDADAVAETEPEAGNDSEPEPVADSAVSSQETAPEESADATASATSSEESAEATSEGNEPAAEPDASHAGAETDATAGGATE